MLKIENTDTYGWQAAFRGMRNPMNSWGKSDSIFEEKFIMGKNDLALAQKLIQAGSEHRKFLRQIFVSTDITAPLYWWKEFDTYKIGTVANSCSTMHKIHDKEFVFDDFSTEHLGTQALGVMNLTINALNIYRSHYLKDRDKSDWWQMIQLLPSSYNQKRTVSMNYENIFNMVRQRKYHKLTEWSNDFIEWAKSLPYAKELIFLNELDSEK